MLDKIITVSDLHKSYGKIKAVKGIDFYVEEGKLFAFLGPNGAGKSTTIDMICTFLKQDSGSVIVDGYELGKQDSEIRNIIGAVFQDSLLDPLLSVMDNLKLRGQLYGLKGEKLNAAIKTAVDATGIESFVKRPYGKLSGGQRRRSDIARALINTPKILFLDEPTTGLDPQTRKSVWETIANIQKKNNMTVFLTTHYMEEATAADYVIVIDDGKIAAKGTPIDLKKQYTNDRLILTSAYISDVTSILQKGLVSFTILSNQITIPIPDTMSALPIIEKCKDLITDFEVIRGSMDDVFISITGREIRE